MGEFLLGGDTPRSQFNVSRPFNLVDPSALGEMSRTANDSFGNGTGNVTGANIGGSYMPVYAQTIIIFMYSTITILAVGGNAIVCFVVLAYQRMRTVTNYFIVNLACSDILMAAVCIPFTFIANVLLAYWPFGDILCPLVLFFQSVTVFLSAFTLVAISLDRYRAIMFPLKPRMTTCQAIIIIVSIWVLSMLVCLPVAVMSRLQTVAPGVALCNEVWPSEQQRYAYSLSLMVLQYFLPLFVLMFTYTRIAIVIWVKKTPGETDNNRDQRLAASKRKMVQMMITVVIIYAMCWLPLHTITLVGDAHPNIYRYPYMQVVWIACHWLAMSNCCYNPIVYCWMNSKFRNGFRYALRCLPCIKYRSEEHGSARFLRMNTHISTMRTSCHDSNRIATPPVKSSLSPFASRIPNNNTRPLGRVNFCGEQIPLKTSSSPQNGSANGMKGYKSDREGKSPCAQSFTCDTSQLAVDGHKSD